MSDEARWSVEQPHVQRAIAFAKRRGSVTTEELIAWDFKHGKRLFTWDDEKGARLNREYEARKFLNHFSVMFQGLRARAFYNLPEDEAAGITERAYFSAEQIAESESMRAIVIGQLIRRMRTVAAELRFWELSLTEQQSVLREVRLALGIEEESAAEMIESEK